MKVLTNVTDKNGQFNGESMIMLRRWLVQWRENGHVTEVVSLMVREQVHVTEVDSLIEGA